MVRLALVLSLLFYAAIAGYFSLAFLAVLAVRYPLLALVVTGIFLARKGHPLNPPRSPL